MAHMQSTETIFLEINCMYVCHELTTQLISVRPPPHVSGYFRFRNFSFPDTATVHTHPANSKANPEKNKSALQSGKK